MFFARIFHIRQSVLSTSSHSGGIGYLIGSFCVGCVKIGCWVQACLPDGRMVPFHLKILATIDDHCLDPLFFFSSQRTTLMCLTVSPEIYTFYKNV